MYDMKTITRVVPNIQLLTVLWHVASNTENLVCPNSMTFSSQRDKLKINLNKILKFYKDIFSYL